MHIFIKQICFSNLIPTWIDMLISTIPKDIYAQKFVAFTSSVLPLFSAACKPPQNSTPSLTSTPFLFTLLTNQPSSSYSPSFHYPCCELMLLLITIHSPNFFFHPSVYPQNWHSFTYGSPLSLSHCWSRAAGKQAMKRGKLISQTQLNQSNIWTLLGSLRARSCVLCTFSVI